MFIGPQTNNQTLIIVWHWWQRCCPYALWEDCLLAGKSSLCCWAHSCVLWVPWVLSFQNWSLCLDEKEVHLFSVLAVPSEWTRNSNTIQEVGSRPEKYNSSLETPTFWIPQPFKHLLLDTAQESQRQRSPCTQENDPCISTLQSAVQKRFVWLLNGASRLIWGGQDS